MKQAPSVAAMVSSMDPDFVRYITNWKLNPRSAPDSGQSQEEVIDIADMLEWHLDSWVNQHKRYPNEIILYRDGLSDGQFEMCKIREIQRIRMMLDEKFKEGRRPKLLVVCTVKRHNTRFLGPLNNRGACDHRRNPVASTVFYDNVTQGDGKDFFLVSHGTLQGTTRPTHYVVLWNEIPKINIEDIAQAVRIVCDRVRFWTDVSHRRTTCAILGKDQPHLLVLYLLHTMLTRLVTGHVAICTTSTMDTQTPRQFSIRPMHDISSCQVWMLVLWPNSECHTFEV